MKAVTVPFAGVDEAGRGPLAGPVVAAAVILDAREPISGLADSKALSARRRAELSREIQSRAVAWSVAWADAAEIDTLNVLQATMLAMRRAIIGLRVQPTFVEVDGNRLPDLNFHGRQLDGSAIVRGDAKIAAISAASIVAKVRRDQIMCQIDRVYPEYGFDRHKGYATVDHRQKLGQFGPCQQHRRTFSPVSSMQRECCSD